MRGRTVEKIKTIRISELITALEELMSKAGDLPIVMSRDSEGNSFGTLNAEKSVGHENGIATLWPWEEYVDFEDIEGFTPDKKPRKK